MDKLFIERESDRFRRPRRKRARLALETVGDEIAAGTFASWARAMKAEDVHGAIDARVRELAGGAGAFLHAGRSRNDQVATTLLLYVRDRAARGQAFAVRIARHALERARLELEAGTAIRNGKRAAASSGGSTHCCPG